MDRRAKSATSLSLPWEESASSLAQDRSDVGLAAYHFQFASPRVRLQTKNSHRMRWISFTPGRPMRT